MIALRLGFSNEDLAIEYAESANTIILTRTITIIHPGGESVYINIENREQFKVFAQHMYTFYGISYWQILSTQEENIFNILPLRAVCTSERYNNCYHFFPATTAVTISHNQWPSTIEVEATHPYCESIQQECPEGATLVNNTGRPIDNTNETVLELLRSHGCQTGEHCTISPQENVQPQYRCSSTEALSPAPVVNIQNLVRIFTTQNYAEINYKIRIDWDEDDARSISARLLTVTVNRHEHIFQEALYIDLLETLATDAEDIFEENEDCGTIFFNGHVIPDPENNIEVHIITATDNDGTNLYNASAKYIAFTALSSDSDDTRAISHIHRRNHRPIAAFFSHRPPEQPEQLGQLTEQGYILPNDSILLWERPFTFNPVFSHICTNNPFLHACDSSDDIIMLRDYTPNFLRWAERNPDTEVDVVCFKKARDTSLYIRFYNSITREKLREKELPRHGHQHINHQNWRYNVSIISTLNFQWTYNRATGGITTHTSNGLKVELGNCQKAAFRNYAEEYANENANRNIEFNGVGKREFLWNTDTGQFAQAIVIPGTNSFTSVVPAKGYHVGISPRLSSEAENELLLNRQILIAELLKDFPPMEAILMQSEFLTYKLMSNTIETYDQKFNSYFNDLAIQIAEATGKLVTIRANGPHEPKYIPIPEEDGIHVIFFSQPPEAETALVSCAWREFGSIPISNTYKPWNITPQNTWLITCSSKSVAQIYRPEKDKVAIYILPDLISNSIESSAVMTAEEHSDRRALIEKILNIALNQVILENAPENPWNKWYLARKEKRQKEQQKRITEEIISKLKGNYTEFLLHTQRKINDAQLKADASRHKYLKEKHKIIMLTGQLTANEKELEKKAETAILSITTHPKFAKLSAVNNGNISIETTPIIMTNPENGIQFHLGEFRIEIPMKDSHSSKPIYYNKTRRLPAYSAPSHHPHVFSNQDVCLGNVESTFLELLHQINTDPDAIYAYFDMAVMFLESVNPRDVAGGSYVCWPLVDKQAVKKEYPIIYKNIIEKRSRYFAEKGLRYINSSRMQNYLIPTADYDIEEDFDLKELQQAVHDFTGDDLSIKDIKERLTALIGIGE
jgi:hypothetical protein